VALRAHILHKAATSRFHPFPEKNISLLREGIRLPLPGLWKVKEQKGEPMKNSLTRVMAVAVFATSISAFAMSENPKTTENKNSGGANVETAMESNVSPTLDGLLERIDQLQGEVQQLKAKDKENQNDTNKNIHQQEKEWEHSLLGIYGG
jgi:hypothetical protein